VARLSGVSWGHRRATAPIVALTDAFGGTRPDITIDWSVRPLSDFEHQGIAGCAAEYDLVVFDHPHCGDIAASGCFLPLESEIRGGAADAGSYVGASLESYRFGGHLWGAPIDGATQHAVLRPDLMDAPPPGTWEEVPRLGERLRRRGLALGLACEGPHAVLAAGALMTNAGAPWAAGPEAPPGIDAGAMAEALEYLRAVLAFCPPEAPGWSSIDLHEAMVARDDIAYCPVVYGYATYGEADMRRRLAFGPLPGPAAPHEAGALIGGAALGVSARCAAPEAAMDFLRFCLEPDRQAAVVGGHHGQPAVAVAWVDPETDARFNGYFSAVAGTMARSAVRPRAAGYPAFQKAAGTIAAAAMAGEMTPRAAAQRIAETARRAVAA